MTPCDLDKSTDMNNANVAVILYCAIGDIMRELLKLVCLEEHRDRYQQCFMEDFFVTRDKSKKCGFSYS